MTEEIVNSKTINSISHYFVHNNGGRPYYVEVSPDLVLIYSDFKAEDIIGNRGIAGTKLIEKKEPCITINNPVKVFIGKDPNFSPEFGDGNTILIQLNNNNKYMFIEGCNIYTFELKSTIKELHSPIGNNDVPYPLAVTVDNKAIQLLYAKTIPLFTYDGRTDTSNYYDDLGDSVEHIETTLIKQIDG
eukprot:TRINITY_DN3254_c0_g1_i1.p1 TRINITY_DN3254_c0_g1~~TRINITY_DN3254_c0_g1_i1.p1  ORF type:complete len:196 (+),score=26.96 TRINITY_DN3254_c0_g1_i1:26-589(+)